MNKVVTFPHCPTVLAEMKSLLQATKGKMRQNIAGILGGARCRSRPLAVAPATSHCCKSRSTVHTPIWLRSCKLNSAIESYC